MEHTELVETKSELKHLGTLARKCHQHLLETGRDHLVYTVVWGLVLNRAKDMLPHGEFGPWLKREVPEMSKGSLFRYMALANSIQDKFPTVGNLKLLGGQTASLELDDEEVKDIAKSAHQFADGRTLTALYRDLDLVRAPRKAGGRKAARHPSAADTVAGRTKAVDELLQTIRTYIKIALDCKDLDRASPEAARLTLDSAVELNARLRQIK